ncbi:MAG TPA: hypothetical protein PLQ50_02035 [Candidatus Woesebacteria bacterium]|nr:hypothetical protein [Candidatus Woesebacteria bacterium]
MTPSDRPVYTHFKDWFGNHYEVNNFVESIDTETVEGKSYLLFNMRADRAEKNRQEKFIFAENNLILES